MAALTSSQRLGLLTAKSQETRQQLPAPSSCQRFAFPDDDEVNRALEDEAEMEAEALYQQEQLEALLSSTE